MTLVLIYSERTENINFPAAFDDYCCIFDEICKVIVETFDFNNLSSNYHMVYYDPPYNLWINFNIHVTKRITKLIRESPTNILKIRIEQHQRNITRSFIKLINKSESQPNEQIRCAHMIIWLDEHIGYPSWQEFKRNCQDMLNTNVSLIEENNIDTLIQCNNVENNIDLTYKSHSQYSIEKTDNYSCPFYCVLFMVNNTDIFYECLDMTSKSTQSVSIIVSEYFAKENLPIIVSRQQNHSLPDVLSTYVLVSDILNCYDWALGFIENRDSSISKYFQLFDNKRELFARVLKDVSSYLLSEADKRRQRKENWHALQYYLTARQLLLNSLRWNPSFDSSNFRHYSQLIEEIERKTTKSLLSKFRTYTSERLDDSDDMIGQQCAEIS